MHFLALSAEITEKQQHPTHLAHRLRFLNIIIQKKGTGAPWSGWFQTGGGGNIRWPMPEKRLAYVKGYKSQSQRAPNCNTEMT